MVHGPPARAQPDSGSRPLESLRSRSLTNPGDYGQTFAPKADSSAVRGSDFRWESPIQFRLGNTSQRRLFQRLNPSLRRDDGNIERASLEYELTDFK